MGGSGPSSPYPAPSSFGPINSMLNAQWAAPYGGGRSNPGQRGMLGLASPAGGLRGALAAPGAGGGGNWWNLNLNPAQMGWANQQAGAMGLGSGADFVNQWNSAANPGQAFGAVGPRGLLFVDQLRSLGGPGTSNQQNWANWINYAGGAGNPSPDSTAPAFTPPAGKSWDPARGGWF